MNHTITIATWNLARPGAARYRRNQAILDKIAEVNADIWVLTETNESIQIDGYSCLATPATSLRRPGERATMIWSRWPLREVPVFTDLPETETPPRVWPSYTVRSVLFPSFLQLRRCRADEYCSCIYLNLHTRGDK
jgi:hypothetical protein